MEQHGFPAYGHKIGEHFAIGPVRVESSRPAERVPRRQRPRLPTGGLLRLLARHTDGTIWAPGDSRLIPDHHLRMPTADAMLFDFSDSEWHFGLDGAIAMANAYPHTHCCCTTGAAWMLPTSAVQCRPGLIAGPGRESGTHSGLGTGGAVRAAASAELILDEVLVSGEGCSS